VCRACLTAWGWKSPIQPDGGEGSTKRKGNIEILSADLKVVLTTDEGESLAKFKEESFQVAKKVGLEFAFVERFFEGEKIEDVKM
jgi:hypothetical protein